MSMSRILIDGAKAETGPTMTSISCTSLESANDGDHEPSSSTAGDNLVVAPWAATWSTAAQEWTIHTLI